MSNRFNLQPAQDQAPIANATFHAWTRPLQADDKAGIDRFVLERRVGVRPCLLPLKWLRKGHRQGLAPVACTPDLHLCAGWAEQASCIRGHSHRVELPERVDVVICDHVGYFGFDYDIVQTLQDARRRFLKPGGSLIPARIRLQLAAVESETGRAKAEVDRFVLSQIDGQTSLGTIAEVLMGRFPRRFTQHKNALTYSADLAERYRRS